MEQALISVVLPVYNVKSYLRRCVESVCRQSYQHLEIILVDDGSTDGSALLCDQLAKQDCRIKVIHQVNGGLSNARNTGIRFAHGEYITLIDSDDYVDSEYVSYLYRFVLKFNTKMSLCMHKVVDESGKIKINYQSERKEECLDAYICLKHMLYHNQIDTSAWGKLYHQSLFQDILYPEGKLFEDIATTYRFLIASKEIACGYESHYYYVVRKQSIVTGKFHLHKLDLLEMTDKMGEDVLRQFPQLSQAVCRRRVYARFSTLNQLPLDKKYSAKRNEMISFIKNHSQAILQDKQAPKRDKIAIYCLLLGYWFYYLVWKVIKYTKGL